jgi:homoserine dehydrogenase
MAVSALSIVEHFDVIEDVGTGGFAETNVSRDLQGADAADKLKILARLAFGADADAVPISRQGMSPADSARLGADAVNGSVVRQVASFDPANGASVKLETLSSDDYLAAAAGAENCLIISGADGSEWRVRGKGAGRWPTAEAVIADVLDIRAWINAKAAAASPRLSNPAPRRRRRVAPA